MFVGYGSLYPVSAAGSADSDLAYWALSGAVIGWLFVPVLACNGFGFSGGPSDGVLRCSVQFCSNFPVKIQSLVVPGLLGLIVVAISARRFVKP